MFQIHAITRIVTNRTKSYLSKLIVVIKYFPLTLSYLQISLSNIINSAGSGGNQPHRVKHFALFPPNGFMCEIVS